jgi:hypothetical protein
MARRGKFVFMHPSKFGFEEVLNYALYSVAGGDTLVQRASGGTPLHSPLLTADGGTATRRLIIRSLALLSF